MVIAEAAASASARAESTSAATAPAQETNGRRGGRRASPGARGRGGRGGSGTHRRRPNKPSSESVGKPAAATTDTAAESSSKQAKPAERTPLQLLVDAVAMNDERAFNDLLAVDETLDLNATTPDGDVLLVEACRYAREAMVATLLERSNPAVQVNTASANRKDNRNGLTPLMAACMTLSLPLVEFLLKHETVDLLPKYDRLHAAAVCVLFSVANGYSEEQASKALSILELVLEYAQKHGQLNKLLAVTTDKGNRLVHVAAGLANWEALKLMHRYGVDVESRNNRGQTPLQMVEVNAFNRRSFALFEPHRVEKKKKAPKHKRKGSANDNASKNEGDAEASASQSVESEADKQTKNVSKKRLDRDVEAMHITRTLLELTKKTGVGIIFSRKGNVGISTIYIKGLVLANLGLATIANEIALLPNDNKDKAVFFDGFLYSVTNLYPLSLKNQSKEFQGIWQQALRLDVLKKKVSDEKDQEAELIQPTMLTPAAFEAIMDMLLSHRSLSRRVKVWKMVLMQLLNSYANDAPLSSSEQPTMALCAKLEFYQKITKTLSHSATKLLFCIFDRTDVEEDESYDEEIEFHLLIALTELFLQFFAVYAETTRLSEEAVEMLDIRSAFQHAVEPLKKLWVLVLSAMDSLDDTISSPQRFSLVLHILQVFDQLEASFIADSSNTQKKLYTIMKQYVKQDITKKRIDYYTASQVHLLQTIAAAFPLPKIFADKVYSFKGKLDILLRSDPKLLGMDLYALASLPDLIRLEHKVDYLGALAEEHAGSVTLWISRASGASFMEFMSQQILSTSPHNMKGELNITLVNEPGVGVGVIRELFQLVQNSFFNPQYVPHLDLQPILSEPLTPGQQPPRHVSEIGSEWLQQARLQSPRSSTEKNGRTGPRAPAMSEFAKLFPLFEFIDPERRTDELRITAHPLHVSSEVIDAKASKNELHLTMQDVMIKQNEVDAMKKMYHGVGRLLGLAIRNHQPLNAHFSLAFWKFMLQQKVSWEEYCGSNEVFKRSLQYILDNDFDTSPLDLQFEYTTEAVVVSSAPVDGADSEKPSSIITRTMEMELRKNMGQTEVTNGNKKQYVELRAQQFFFGHEFDFYKKMRDGLLDTIRRVDLKLFHPEEMRIVVRGDRTIDFSSLKKVVLYSQGASPSHGVIVKFWEVVESFDQPTRAKLLTFWSGSPLPPLFGFESKYRSMNADTTCWYIEVDPRMKISLCPMANTCDRRLMLPPYPTKEVLKEKILVALEHGALGYDRM